MLVIAASLSAFVIWFNGPGIRWIGPWVAHRYLDQRGIEAQFHIDGSLTGGISLRDIRISGSAIPLDISAHTVTPIYQIRDALRGRMEGLAIDKLHLVIDLDKPSQPRKPDVEAEPFDPQQLAATLRAVRAQIAPLDLNLTSIRVDVVRGPTPFLSLAPSSLAHRSHSPEFLLQVGQITDPQERVWPAQQTTLRWTDELVHLDRIDPLPGIGLRDLSWSTPMNTPTYANVRLLVDDAALALESGPAFQDIRLDLLEGRLDIASLLARFQIDHPATGSISSLSFNGTWPDGNPAAEIRLLAEKIDYEGWQAEELNIDSQLDSRSIRFLAAGRALGAPVRIEAAAPVEFLAVPILGEVSGTLAIGDIPAAWAGLSQKISAMDAQAVVPASSLEADFRIGMRDNQLVKISAEANLIPTDPAHSAPLAATASWAPGKALDTSLRTQGIDASATIDFTKREYKGSITLNEFRKSDIAPWLTMAKVRIDGDILLTGRLQSAGSLTSLRHNGFLDITHGSWTRQESQAIQAAGRIDFQWPGSVKITGLRATSGDQQITLDGVLADGSLDIPTFAFREKDVTLLDGSLRLPVPADFSDWKETISRDKRPIQVNLQSQVIPLRNLRHWLPRLAEFAPSSTGRLKVQASGTYAKPDIRGSVELNKLLLEKQAGLPPADVSLDLLGRAGKLDVTGRILTPGYEPALLKAHTDFLPAAWAEHPDLWTQAAITGRVDLPNIRLARFLPLLPKIERLDGTLNGHAQISGTAGEPVLTGNLRLTDGLIQPNPQIYPAVRGISAEIDLGLDRIRIKSLRASAAGGDLTITGGMPIIDGKPGPMDITAKGNNLLVRRDDKLVVRAHADLHVTGPVDAATIAGTVSVVDSLFYRDLEIIPVGLPFIGPTAASLPKFDAPSRATSGLPSSLAGWKLALRLRTGTPFLIRGTLGNGTITGDLDIGGRLAAPEPRGEVFLNEASLALPYTTLRVQRGIVRFTGTLDPTLEIRGIAEPRPYQVFLYLYGKAGNPEILLTSSPPLPQNEIISLLATGTTPAGLEDSKVATSRALQLLAEEVRRGRVNIARPLRPLLSLTDRVDFTLADEDPYTGTRFSTTTLSLTDRWLLAASMGEDGETRVMGIWRLSFR